MMLGMLTAATLGVAVWHPFAVYHERNADNEQYIETDFAPPADTSGTQAGTGTDTDTDTDDIITDSSDQLPDEGLAKESDDIDEASPTDTVIPTSLEYTVASGDSLSAILTQYGIDSSDVALLSNQYKGLRNLQIGQTLAWELNDDGELKSLSWAVNRRETRTYVRSGNGFKETKEMREGEWQTKRLTGKVSGSLNASASKAGLTRSEVRDISKALQWQVDVRKVKNGDRFTVLTSREMLDGKQEQSQMLAVRLHTNGRDYYAFRAEDGRFYDAKGDGLERGFLRFPTARQFRVSSHFNPRRVNPVTGVLPRIKGSISRCRSAHRYWQSATGKWLWLNSAVRRATSWLSVTVVSSPPVICTCANCWLNRARKSNAVIKSGYPVIPGALPVRICTLKSGTDNRR